MKLFLFISLNVHRNQKLHKLFEKKILIEKIIWKEINKDLLIFYVDILSWGFGGWRIVLVIQENFSIFWVSVWFKLCCHRYFFNGLWQYNLLTKKWLVIIWWHFAWHTAICNKDSKVFTVLNGMGINVPEPLQPQHRKIMATSLLWFVDLCLLT